MASVMQILKPIRKETELWLIKQNFMMKSP